MTESDLNYWKSALSVVVPKELITPEVVALRDQQNKMLNLMAKKNADYDNAFNLGCNDLGIKYGLARIYDKAKRVINLTSHEFNDVNIHHVTDESLIDTIQDLGNYCNMLLAWLSNEPSIPSTGELGKDNIYIDIYQMINNGNSILIDDETKKDVTKEIIEDYGLDNLCRNDNAYIYNVNKDDSIVSVTTRKGNLVRIISKSLYNENNKSRR